MGAITNMLDDYSSQVHHYRAALKNIAELADAMSPERIRAFVEEALKGPQPPKVRVLLGNTDAHVPEECSGSTLRAALLTPETYDLWWRASPEADEKIQPDAWYLVREGDEFFGAPRQM